MEVLQFLGAFLFQAEAAAEAVPLHLIGAALGAGLVVVGAGMGIGKFTAAAADGIARQPSSASEISSVIMLPLFLLEGVAIIAEVIILLMVL